MGHVVLDVPRKGNVDRNRHIETAAKDGNLDVPRKGNVDRNMTDIQNTTSSARTFPARGTWIEILPDARASVTRL